MHPGLWQDVTASLFAEALLENSSTKPGGRKGRFIVSLMAHGILLAALLLTPLYFTDGIDFARFRGTQLVGQPAPSLPKTISTAVRLSVPPKTKFPLASKLSMPSPAVNQVALAEQKPAAPDLTAGVGPYVPGTLPGGQVGGVIGGILSSAPSAYVPPPPTKPALEIPMRVGGDVKEPRLISLIEPVYPVILRQAKVSGDVVIDAIVDANGNVGDMRPISGHRLLIPAAMDAVRRWKYEPTLLNGRAIPVIVRVTITFKLKSSLPLG